ncbi:SDR family oxidoreductase [Microlunatus sp. Gsoil 973]|nr:SDR family oxidoreductase [Microlunatus sp. Gsoil 973]
MTRRIGSQAESDDREVEDGRGNVLSTTEERDRGYTVYLIVIAVLGWSLASYDSNILTLTMPDIASEFRLSSGILGVLGFIVYGAEFILALFVGWGMDRRGRKWMWMFCLLLAALFTGLTFFVQSFWQLAVVRALASGFAQAELAVSITLVNEQVPSRRRGLLYSIVQGGWPIGVFLVSGLYLLVGGWGWRTVYLFGVIPLILVAVGRLWIKESERFLHLRAMRRSGGSRGPADGRPAPGRTPDGGRGTAAGIGPATVRHTRSGPDDTDPADDHLAVLCHLLRRHERVHHLLADHGQGLDSVPGRHPAVGLRRHRLLLLPAGRAARRAFRPAERPGHLRNPGRPAEPRAVPGGQPRLGRRGVLPRLPGDQRDLVRRRVRLSGRVLPDPGPSTRHRLDGCNVRRRVDARQSVVDRSQRSLDADRRVVGDRGRGGYCAGGGDLLPAQYPTGTGTGADRYVTRHPESPHEPPRSSPVTGSQPTRHPSPGGLFMAQPTEFPDQRTAVITGGASERGIGKATARRLAAAGWSVAIMDVSVTDAERTAEEISSRYDVRAVGVGADVADPESVDAAFGIIERELPPVVGLANVAGISSPTPFMETTVAEWDRVMAINLRGAFVVTQRALHGMIDRRLGRIVSISSISAQRGGGTYSKVAYSASKAGLLGFTRAVAREVGEYGVTVNAVAPGPIDTDIMGGTLTDDRKAEMSAGGMLGRVGTPDEVAALIAFLLGPDAGYITAATYDINGGIQIS